MITTAACAAGTVKPKSISPRKPLFQLVMDTL